MKVLVCGGRDYADAAKIDEVLSSIDNDRGILMLIHGGATGADTLAGEWAWRQGVHVAEVKANWDYYKKAAGPIRNQRMLTLNPDLVVAFPGGKGTENMIGKAQDKGIPVRIVY